MVRSYHSAKLKSLKIGKYSLVILLMLRLCLYMLQFVSYKFMKVKGYINNMKLQARGAM